MRNKISPMMTIAALALALAGCGDTANYNTNANANRAANANVAVANTNANASPSPRRGVTRAEYDRDKDRYTREAKESGRTIGSGLNDGWLWAKTKFDLAAADDLRDSTINVDVDNDVVTLSGTVANAAQKARAEAVAKSVEGVKSVKNMLKVTASGNTNK
ncbi:MAG TPA: BON domain-containing protein [Pyrinomonadaceae bacterium]|nr:BON domain-containing protein [Pyrinomonadaceae bacterium]